MAKTVLNKLLALAVQNEASDIHLKVDGPAVFRVGNDLVDTSYVPDAATLQKFYDQITQEEHRKKFHDVGDVDVSLLEDEVGRFRVNLHRQRGTIAINLRHVKNVVRTFEELGLPDTLGRISETPRGIIFVTGTTGSGKSTTLASMMEYVNQRFRRHIITIEDPIEYLHPHKQCLVSQREVPGDASTFARALRAALRQAPDVIMLGEMRDIETISTAITAAETGHLLLSSLHTLGAAKTIDRVIDAFPANQQNQIRAQLSMVLRAVVSQRLILTNEGRLHPVFEVMCVNPAIQNLIREGKTHQIDNAIFGGGADMLSMDTELARLLRDGKIDKEQASLLAIHPETVERQARFMRD